MKLQDPAPDPYGKTITDEDKKMLSYGEILVKLIMAPSQVEKSPEQKAIEFTLLKKLTKSGKLELHQQESEILFSIISTVTNSWVYGILMEFVTHAVLHTDSPNS